MPLLRINSPYANDCLDLEDGRHDVGLPIQVWQCNPNTNNKKCDCALGIVHLDRVMPGVFGEAGQ